MDASLLSGRTWYGHSGIFRRVIPLVAFLLLFLSTYLFAQVPPLDSASAGTAFIVAFPGTVTNIKDTRFPDTRVAREMSVWLYSAVDTWVKVTRWDSIEIDTIRLVGGEVYVHTIMADMRVKGNGPAGRLSYIYESTMPVIAYCYYAGPEGAEAWTPIPVEMWGREYRVASQPAELVYDVHVEGGQRAVREPRHAPATILLVGAYPDTRVKVTPPAGVKLIGMPMASAGIPLEFGEVYQLQCVVDTTTAAGKLLNPAATLIESNNPIGVLSGNTRSTGYPKEITSGSAFKNLLIEWLPSVSHYGTQFVIIPTMDGHTRPTVDTLVREFERASIYNAQSTPMTAIHRTDVDDMYSFEIEGNSFAQFSLWSAIGTYVKTSGPAMAMFNSTTIMRRADTPQAVGDRDIWNIGYAPYMAEITPREQWTSFAPVYAPANPAGMSHYVNVVTDSITALGVIWKNGTPFHFTRTIPGTDLVWGTAQLTPGRSNWLYASKGGTFAGTVYGLLKGEERYRIIDAAKKHGGRDVAAGDERAMSAGSIDEFEEYNALSYGYPLAPRRQIFENNGLVLITDTIENHCDVKRLKLTLAGSNSEGFLAVELDPSTVRNAKLESNSGLVNLADLGGRREVEFAVTALDRGKDASATIVIRTTNGYRWTYDYSFVNSAFRFSRAPRVDFGTVPRYENRRDTVYVKNVLPRPIRIDRLGFYHTAEGFVAGNPDVPGPWTLQPGDSMGFPILFRANRPGRYHHDTLYAYGNCYTAPLLLTAVIEESSDVPSREEGRLALRAYQSGGDMRVQFTIPRAGRARLVMFNSAGYCMRVLADDLLNAGAHDVEWNTDALPSGLYFVRLEAGGVVKTASCLVLH